jgi:hypothetical protein
MAKIQGRLKVTHRYDEANLAYDAGEVVVRGFYAVLFFLFRVVVQEWAEVYPLSTCTQSRTSSLIQDLPG